MEELNDIYNELIMEHSMNSYNKKELENADYSEIGHNPNCGDEITLQLKMDGNIIEDMAFSGHGCAISQASTSIMIDTLRGKTVEQAKDIIKTGKMQTFIYVIPFVILTLVTNIISTINYNHYGIYTYNELNDSNFT